MDLLNKYNERGSGASPEAVEYTEASADMSTAGAVTKLLVKLSGGFIHSERQANIVMIVLVVLFIGVSLYTIFGGSSATTTAPTKLPPTQRGF